MSTYDESEEESDYQEAMQMERIERKKAAEPFMFKWCEKCTLLRGCYFQHGTRDTHPHFLNQECGEGPSTL